MRSLRRLVLLLLCLGPVWPAAAQVWVGTNGQWFTGSNWVGGAAPVNDGTASVEILGTGYSTVIFSSNVSIASLVFNASAPAIGLTHSSGALTVGTGGITNNSSSAHLFSVGILLAGDQSWSAGGTMTFSGAIGGTGNFTKTGAGTVIFNNDNSYAGTTTISAGTLQLGAATYSTTGSVGTGAILNNGALLVQRANAVTMANAISGTGTLTKTGAGTLTLTGANTFTGTTTISGGAIQVGSGTIGSIVGDIVDNALLIFGRTDDASYAGAISGTGAVTKNGAGTLVLSGANSHTGGTTLAAGTLSLGSSGALGTSGTLTLSGGTLQFTSSNVSDYSARFSTAASQQYRIDTNGRNVTFASALTSSGGTLTKLGAGTLTLTGANTYTGGTTLAAGTLALGSSGALGTTGTLTWSGGALQFTASNTTDYSSRFSTAATQQYRIDTNGQAVTLATALTSSGGALTKLGAGTLTLTGANTYTGGTTLGDGTLALGSSGALGATGALTFSGGALQFTASNTTDYSGRFSTAAGQQYRIDTNGRSVTFASALGSADGTLTKLGTGTLTLTGTNTYGGTTTVSAGALNLQNSAALGTSAGGTTVAAGAALEVQGGITVAAEPLTLSGTGVSTTGALRNRSGANAFNGPVTLGAAATIASDSGTLTLGGALDLAAYGLTVTGAGNSAISGVIAGTGGVTKTGSGILALTGDNTHSGGVAINGGLVEFSSLNNFGSGSLTVAAAGGLRWAAGTTLDISNRVTTFAQGATLDTNGNDITLANTAFFAAGFTKAGAGTFTVPAGTNLGVVNLDGGTLAFSGGLGSLQQSPAGSANGRLLATGDVTVSGMLQMTASSTLTIDTNGHTVAINGHDAGGWSAPAVMGAATALIKNGAGTLSFAYKLGAGPVTINAGELVVPTITSSSVNIGAGTLATGQLSAFTVNLNQGGTIKALGAYSTSLGLGSSVAVAAEGTFDTNGYDVTLGHAISGAGTLTKTGTGTLTLSAGATVGGLTISQGTLKLLSDVSAAVSANSTIVLETAGTATLSGTLSGPGGLTKQGAGTFILGSTNQLSGDTAVTAGWLQIDANNRLTTGSLTLNGGGIRYGAAFDDLRSFTLGAGGATLDTNGYNVTYSPVIAGSSTLTKSGTGTLTLAGANTWSGGTVVNAGTLAFGAAGNLGSGNVTLNGGTLQWAGANTADLPANLILGASGGTVDVGANNVGLAAVISGNGALTKAGAGTLTFDAAKTYTGATNVGAGTLRLGASEVIANGSTVTVASGATFDVHGQTETIGALAGAGAVTLGGGALTTGASNASATFSGVLSGAGTLTKSGSGAFTLSGLNTYSGATTISGGSLVLGANGVLPAASAVTVASGTTLNVNGRTQTIGSLAGAGTVSLGAGALTVALDWAATWSGAVSGTGTLAKTGTGTLTLSGSSTWSGGLAVRSGTVEFSTLGNLGTGNVTLDGGTLRWAAGSTVDVSGRLAAFASGGGTLDTQANNITLATALTGVGGLTKTGSGALTLSAANTYDGGTTISAGTLQLGAGGTTGALAGGVAIDGSATLAINRSDAFTLANAISGTGAVVKSGSNTLTLSGDSPFSGLFTANGGTLQIGAGGSSGSLAGDVSLASGTTLRFNRADASTFGGAISGAGALLKTTGELLTLTGNSTFSGGTTLAAGTLAVGGSSPLGTGRLALNGGTLQAAAGGATIGAPVSLNADTTIAGSQPLTVAGAVTLNGFKALTVANTARTTFSGGLVESSPSIFIKQGAGELELTGASTYTGGTFIQAGTVRINNSSGSAFGSGAVTVASGATLAGAGAFSGALQLNGVFSPGNSPGLTQTGSETWAGGGGYRWEIANATGTAGTHWDLLSISGTLTIAATNDDRFTVSVVSLLADNSSGDAINFTSGASHQFTIASASGGILGFATDRFAFDLSGFTNLASGTWSIAQAGHDLNLVYTPAASAVPEPATYALLAGVGALGLAFWRRRR